MYENSKLLKLEQNYRSTRTIVDASNAVVKNNKDRIDKTCFSENELGDEIIYTHLHDNLEEANFIANEIISIGKYNKISYNEMAILYRTNSQSRSLEQELLKAGVPYKVIGAVNFGERKEIKDIMSYLKVYYNRKDKVAFARALGTLDGVGEKTIDSMLDYMTMHNLDALETILKAPVKGAKAVNSLRNMFIILNNKYTKASDILKQVSQEFIAKLKIEGTEDANNRISNIEELISVALEKENNNITLDEFIVEMDLMNSAKIEDDVEAVSLMTVHSSKGLEFTTIFACGLNDGLLPHCNCMASNLIEEERRLMYVAMTRAKKLLYLSSYKYGVTDKGSQSYNPSRFIKEIPQEFIYKNKQNTGGF